VAFRKERIVVALVMKSRPLLALIFTLAGSPLLFADPTPELETIMVGKRIFNTQIGPAATVRAGESPYQFRVGVSGNNLDALETVPTFSTPGGGSSPLVATDAEGHEWEFKSDHETQVALDGAYPNGTYGVTIADQTVNLSLTGDAYPVTPYAIVSAGTWTGNVLTVDAAQALTIDTNVFDGFGSGILSHLALRVYGPFGNSSSEFVELDSFFGDIFEGEENPGSSSLSHTFQIGDLIAGTTYFVEIEFDQAVALGEEYADALAVALYSSTTRFRIDTLAAVPEPGTYALLAGLGVFGLVVLMRRRASA